MIGQQFGFVYGNYFNTNFNFCKFTYCLSITGLEQKLIIHFKYKAMKNLLLTLLLLLAFGFVQAQVPQGFNYQSVATDASGSQIQNTALQVKIGITSNAAGTVFLWEEQHSVTTNSQGLFSLVVGHPSATKLRGTTFQAINWAAAPLYIRTEIQYQGVWYPLGATQLWSVPYSMLASKTTEFSSVFTFDQDTVVILKPLSIGSTDAGGALLSVTSVNDLSEGPLFEVKRKDGQTVFAVYNDAVNIFVPSVTPGKGSSKGGFAIGSFDDSKAGGISQDYFRVTPDSVRVYINSNPTFTKAGASKGGFAIGSFDDSKGPTSTYFNITAASVVDTVRSRAQILWYPRKEAFLAGRVHIGSADSVGLNSTALGYHSIAKGNYSQAFGYKAMALANNSTAVGNNSRASGSDSYALGSFAEATGARSFALGSVGVDKFGNLTSQKTTATGPYTVAIGMGAQALTQKAALAIGTNTVSSGFAATSIGYASTASNSYSVAIGYYANATGLDAYAFGSSAEAAAEKSFAIGTYGLNGDGTPNLTRPTRTTGTYSLAMGMGAQSTQKGAMAFGVNTTASGQYTTAIGYNSESTANYATALGYSTLAGAIYSTALGYNTTASGDYATAIGYNASASGPKSISVGAYYSYTIWRRSLTPPFLILPVVINRQNTATDEYSIAIGNGNTATKGGLAVGSNNYASATSAVAIGHSNYADSAYSFAAGYGSRASGHYAVAMGELATAQAANSFVVGTYNVIAGDKVEWLATDPLFVIGNGTSSLRANAMTVLKNGNVILPQLSAGTGTTAVISASGYLLKLSSSIKYKENVTQLSDVSWLYQLKPVSYNYIEDQEKALQYGLIAEDVEKINKSLVIYNKEGSPDGIYYNSLISSLIKAAQEQQTIIESQQKELDELRAMVEALKATVQTIVNK